MSKQKRFNKFGQFGIEQLGKHENTSHFETPIEDYRIGLIETAKAQLAELELMKDKLSNLNKMQFQKLKAAYRRSYGVLSEGQLRWLQGLYDSRFYNLKKTDNSVTTIHVSIEKLQEISQILKKK